MAVKKKEKPIKKPKAAPPEKFPKELRETIWSVISFDKCEARNLTYTEAERKLAELEAQNISGLCIVTNEVAARLKQ